MLSFSQYDSQRNIRLVWDETIRIMFDLFDNVWGDSPEVVLDHCVDITLPVGRRMVDLPTNFQPSPSDRPFCHWRSRYFSRPCILILIFATCSLGFGRRITWTSDLIVPPGHQMTFKDALHVSAAHPGLKIVLPTWAMNLTEHTRKIELAYKELEVLCPR